MVAHVRTRSGMAQHKIELDAAMGIFELTLLQQSFWNHHEPRFLVTFADGAIEWGFIRRAFPTRKFGKTRQRSIGAPNPDKVSTLMLDDGNSNFLGRMHLNSEDPSFNGLDQLVTVVPSPRVGTTRYLTPTLVFSPERGGPMSAQAKPAWVKGLKKYHQAPFVRRTRSSRRQIRGHILIRTPVVQGNPERQATRPLLRSHILFIRQ